MNKIQYHLLLLSRTRQVSYLTKVFKKSCVGCKTTGDEEKWGWRKKKTPYQQAWVVLNNAHYHKKFTASKEQQLSVEIYLSNWIINDKMKCSSKRRKNE